MNINYDNNNVLEINGKIAEPLTFSHNVLGEGFYESKIETKRLSNEVDILPITISERLCADIKVGDNVNIIGQFRSYNKQDVDKNRLMLTVFVREINKNSDFEPQNHINLTGYICKEPIYRTTPFGREIADVLLAVNRAYNKSDYIPCIAWGRNARFVSELQVGEKIEIAGRVQSRNYQKKTETEIINKTAYEISISSIKIAEEDEIKQQSSLISDSSFSNKSASIIAQ